MEGRPISIPELLQARDDRAQKQAQLLSTYFGTLVCFTMNIAGPIKVNPLILDGFHLGNRWFRSQLQAFGISILFFEEQTPDTGCEAYYILDCSPESAKRIACALEDGIPLGRLFDIDVLATGIPKLSRQDLGFPARSCLLCGKDAMVCGRSRAHTVQQLQEKTQKLLKDAVFEEESRQIGSLAEQSLLYEVCVTPKPGLVDRSNSGSHRDMDIFTFMASSAALSPYFRDCARAGMETAHLPPQNTFRKLRLLGQLAEGTMFRSTNGINTHKGAIFILGLLCGSAGRLSKEQRTPEAIALQCAAMTKGITQDTLHPVTSGQQFLRKHGITGIRGEAEAGFPSVLQAGLPALRHALSCGLNDNDAGCAALLAILSHAEDTNLIARSDWSTQQQIQQKIRSLLQKSPFPGQDILEKLDAEFIEKNLSPGGSADLLAASYFLHFLCDAPSDASFTL